jgi:hypothetical protein
MTSRPSSCHFPDFVESGLDRLTARQLLEPTTESLKAAASDMYDDLKELEGEVADKAEAYLEEMFPGIAHESEEQDEELAVEEAVDQDFLDASKPLEHADETEPVAEVNPSTVKGGHHRNGTHHRRPGHKNKHKHNSTHGNDTETPVFEPERYFTEPLITGLLVTFLVFIPLIAMGIAALSSIQVRLGCGFGNDLRVGY